MTVGRRTLRAEMATVCPRTLAEGMMKLYLPSASVTDSIRISGTRTEAPTTARPLAVTRPLTVIACWAVAIAGSAMKANNDSALLLHFVINCSFADESAAAFGLRD